MGLRRIGRRISRGFRRVTRGRIFRSIKSFAGGLISKVTKKLSSVLAPFQKVVNGILNKLPLPNVVKAFAGQFLSNPLSLLSGGVLGPIAGMIGAAPGMGSLLGMAQSFAPTNAFMNPQGAGNLMQMFAHRQSRFL